MSNTPPKYPLTERRLRNIAGPQRSVTANQVKAYLRRYPNILRDDPLLLARVIPTTYNEDGTVRDLQRYVIERLQRQLQDMAGERNTVLEASQLNMEAQARVHEAVLMLLGARTFEHLVEIVTRDLAPCIGVEAVCLCVEGVDEFDQDHFAADHAHDVHVLAPGMVDELLGEEATHTLRSDVEGTRLIFGRHAVHIHSEALIRLHFSRNAPAGLLAIGSREPEMFHPEQGADLLNFLARVLERCVRAWLDLPPEH